MLIKSSPDVDELFIKMIIFVNFTLFTNIFNYIPNRAFY